MLGKETSAFLALLLGSPVGGGLRKLQRKEQDPTLRDTTALFAMQEHQKSPLPYS